MESKIDDDAKENRFYRTANNSPPITSTDLKLAFSQFEARDDKRFYEQELKLEKRFASIDRKFALESAKTWLIMLVQGATAYGVWHLLSK